VTCSDYTADKSESEETAVLYNFTPLPAAFQSIDLYISSKYNLIKNMWQFQSNKKPPIVVKAAADNSIVRPVSLFFIVPALYTLLLKKI
jgi:light-regulated signal transduction histidine kinase (bacteriophytochrome)